MAAARRTRNRLVSGAAVVVLAAINVIDHTLHPPWWVRALEGAGLVAWARLDGLTWSQLGLGRDRLGAGCRWALGAIGLVAGVYVVGVLLPLTRPAFQDARYDLPIPDALGTAFVVIPLGTVAARGARLPLRPLGDARATPAPVAGAGHHLGAVRVLARLPGAERRRDQPRRVRRGRGSGQRRARRRAPSRSRPSGDWSSASCAGAATACSRAPARTGRPMPSACCSGWWPGAWTRTDDRISLIPNG